jgi:glycosyltransferase involved in cell wall biosynthesis
MDQPRISIVTPSFNQGQFVERTLRSVLEQGYPNLEYIVIDGGSTDNSAEIIKRYAERLTYLVSESDRGQSHAINKGFERCTGDIYTWLNSDDYLLPGALDAVARAYVADPRAGAWVGACMHAADDGTDQSLLDAQVLDLDILGHRWPDVFFGQPSCFFSAQAWQECGPLDEHLHLSMDLDLWLKMLKNHRFVHVPGVLSYATIHKDAKTVAQRHRSMAQSWLVRARHGFADAVEDEIAQTLTKAEADARRVRRITRTSLYRVARPLLKALGLVGDFEA